MYGFKVFVFVLTKKKKEKKEVFGFCFSQKFSLFILNIKNGGGREWGLRKGIRVRFDGVEGDRIDIRPEIQGVPYRTSSTFQSMIFYWKKIKNTLSLLSPSLSVSLSHCLSATHHTQQLQRCSSCSSAAVQLSLRTEKI